jgi:hypothetical protein
VAVKLAVQSTFSDKGMRKAKGSIAGLDKYARASFKRIAGYIAGAFAFTKIVGFVKNATGAYFQQQQAVEGLRQALASTGEATDENMAKLQKVASALEVVTRAGADSTLALMTLGKSLGIATGNLDEAATAAIVFNKRFGINAETAMRGLASAFRGNAQLLSRYIPQLQGVTDANQAYNIIMMTSSRLLREQAELGMTTAERAKAVQAAWSSLTVELGAFIVESGLAEDVLDTLLFALEDIQEVGLAEWFEDTFPALDEFIDRVVGLLRYLGMLQDYVEEEWMTPKSTEQKVNDVIGTPFVGETEADIWARMEKRKAEAAKVMQQPELMGPPAPSERDLELQQPELMGPPAPSERDLKRAGRRDERRRRREERAARASALIASLRGELETPQGGEAGGGIDRQAGGQRLGIGELFERAYDGIMQKKEPTGTADDPIHVTLLNPEDVNTGLA